jgi:type IX secretion system PorP/SprF family membrane protein
MASFCTIKIETSRYNSVLKRYAFILVLLLLVSVKARGQYDPSFSHFWGMESSFNPASVGKENKINVVVAYALNMAGFEHNPRTMYLGADMPFLFAKNYHGVGVQLMNDQIGLFTHQKLGLQYAFKHKLFGGIMSLGLQAGILSESFKGSELDLNDSSDPAFSTSDINGNGLDLSAGLYYSAKQWYAGASVLHANAPTIDMGETNEMKIDRTYYLTGGYNIKLRNPFITIPINVLGQSDFVDWRADVTGRLVYTNGERMMYAGAGYSPGKSVTAMIGGNFHGISIHYSYEIYTSAISVGNGSHELMVGYQTDINLLKKEKNKHKSVRIL